MRNLPASANIKRLLGGASAFAMVAAMATLATPSFAEEEEAELKVEELVVYGYRGSLANAVSVKRNADTVVEALSAQDIGRLPDISIAESLSRLPGITSQRTSGQSSAINVRGLPQNLVFTTLNGREQVTPNGARAVEFEQFPSELISGVEVYKSPKASLLEGGVAGTVNFNTIRPLSNDERIVSLNVRASYNDRANEIFGANEIGYRLSAAYVDQFADGKVGLSIGYARLEQPDVAVRFAQFDFTGGSNDFNGDGVNDSPSFGFETTEDGGNETRDGIIATLQFQPTDNFSLDIDAYYSRFKSESFRRGVRITGPQAVNFGNTTVTDPVVSGSALIGGTFSRNTGAPTDGGGFGLTAANVNDDLSDDDELVSIGSKAEYVSDRWTFTADFTYSRADSEFTNEVSAILPLTSLDGGVPGVSNSQPNTPVLNDDLTVFLDSNGTSLPVIDISQDFTDTSQVFLSRFGVFPTDNTDELVAFAGSVEYEADWGIISTIEFGARYSDREASQTRASIDFGNDAGFFQFAGNFLTPIDLTGISSVECFAGDFAANGFPCFLAVEDPRGLVEDQVGPFEANQDAGFTRIQSFTLKEKVFSAFVQMNIDAEVGDVPVSGNIGLRVVDTDQSSLSQDALENGFPASGLEFTEFLPSANFAFEISENDTIRIGASRAFARPPIFELGAGFSVSFDAATQQLTLSGTGNPTLRPTIANQFDVSYEHYFENGGIVSLAVFYKDLETFVANERLENVDLSTLDLGSLLNNFDEFVAAGGNPLGIVNGVVNGDGGYVWGIELGASIPFDLFSEGLRDFGFVGSYAYTESSVDFTSSRSGSALTLDLPGLSNHVINATLYYENESGFGSRVSLRHRSSFISPQLGIDNLLPNTTGETIIDFQTSYEFDEDHSLAGLSLLFQASNLTDEPTTTFFGSEAQTGTIQNFGRQFFLGASYKF